MSERHSFGGRLRATREQRGISIATLTAATRVSGALWEGLERNDLSRWPSGIFARSFVRDYARVIGLDETELVDEFCRIFPAGDRRVQPTLEAHARLIGHEPNLSVDAGGLPPEGDRRAPAAPPVAPPPSAARVLMAPRALATALDTSAILAMAGAASFAFRTGFYENAGVIATLYYGVATMAVGSSPGSMAVIALRQRVPSLFNRGLSRRRARAHA